MIYTRNMVKRFNDSLDFRVRTALREALYLTLGALILAVNFNIFLAPSKMAPGGVSGIGLIINRFTQWPLGLTMVLFSVPIIILGFYNMGRYRFLARTGYVTVLYGLSVDLTAQWLAQNGITGDLLLNALYGGVVGGIGSGLLYRGRGAAAGTGVISRILQLKTGLPISQLYILIDGVVILGLGLIFGWDKALYAMLMLIIWGMTADYVLEGPSVVRTAFIVTNAPDRVSQALLERLGLGVTAWDGQGMFTGERRAILFCTVNRPDVNDLKQTVYQADGGAFVVIGQGHQATGGVVRGSAQIEHGQIPERRGLAMMGFNGNPPLSWGEVSQAECISCHKEIAVDPSVGLGDLISCTHCRADLELVDLEPLQLDWPEDPLVPSRRGPWGERWFGYR